MIPPLKLTSAGSKLSVLCLGAHSDDIEIGAGATLLQWKADGILIDMMWCVLSAVGPALSLSCDALWAPPRFSPSRKCAILGWRSRIDSLLFSIGLSFLILIAIAFLPKISASYSRGWLVTWLVLSALLLTASRPVMAHLLSWMAATGYTARRIAVVGDGSACERLVHTLCDMSGIQVAGVFAGPNGRREPALSNGIAWLCFTTAKQ
jgi:hypothetical protein